MTKTRQTHNGRKTSVFVNQDNFVVYFSRPNKGIKSESTYLTVSGVNPDTQNFTKIRLDGRQVASLRKVLQLN